MPYLAKLTLRDVPAKEGYTFAGWDGAPEKMPAENITLYGNYISGIENVKVSGKADAYTLDGILYKHNVNLNELNESLPKGIYILNGKKYVVGK